MISMISLPPPEKIHRFFTCEIQLKECPSKDGRRKEQRLALECGFRPWAVAVRLKNMGITMG